METKVIGGLVMHYGLLKYMVMKNVLMNGGRQKWIDEKRDVTKDISRLPRLLIIRFHLLIHDIRAFRDDVEKHSDSGLLLIDVRSPKEYSGELFIWKHILKKVLFEVGIFLTLKSVPWATAANEDGTFKSADELASIYKDGAGLDPNQDIIAYCRIGERSSHTWFVLTYLLGI